MLKLSLGSNSTHPIEKNKDDELLYVVTPQRLDQNTSGLFVVATKKEFASYYAKLLRTKTDAVMQQRVVCDGEETNSSLMSTQAQIKKKYRCLVCLISKHSNGEEISVMDEFDRLLSLENSLVTHYLEKGMGAPRTFSSESNADWLQCLMKITNVGRSIPVDDSVSSKKLCTAIWGNCGKLHDPFSVEIIFCIVHLHVL